MCLGNGNRHLGFFILVFFAVLWVPFVVKGEQKTIKMSTTTSTLASGLLDVLLPELEKDTGIRVKVIAKGTGAAIRDGMDGNVDVIFVHDRTREETFVSEGYGTYRLGVMHNDFLILGPPHDPAGIKGMKDAVTALEKISATGAKFVSRGDDSGTHSMEQRLWTKTKVQLKTKTTTVFKKGKKKGIIYKYPEGMGRSYISIGQGMGKTITYAEEKQAYTLADRGTYIKYKFGRKEGIMLEVLSEGDKGLYNPYGVIPLNPERFKHINFELADRFAKWLVSFKAQALIANYKLMGQQLFYPDAIPGAK
jgi:tungstate transport system substrate-binding protein